MKSQQVTFIDYNGTVLKTQFVEVGEDASPPSVTARTGYQFAGWNGSYTNVTQDSTVQATYEPIVYTVTFLDLQGNVIQTRQVTYNNAVTAPAAPPIEGKTFVQWTQATNKVTSNMTVSPEYLTAIYQVRFFDQGELVKTTNVEHGNNAVAPVMNREGHDFQGWTLPVTAISSSMDVEAVWVPKSYDVYFYDHNGTLISHQQISYQQTATAPIFQAPVGQQLQTWDQSFDNVTSELHINPVLETLKVHVYYMDEEELLHQETLDYGTTCTGFTPTKPGHDFESWSQECDNVTSDVTLQAAFAPHEFNVVFMDFLGNVIKEETVAYQQSATPPSTTFPNYRFDGWNASYESITADLVVRPLGEVRTYRAVFKNVEGMTLCEFNVNYGETVQCDAPQRQGFEFTSWSAPLTITEDVTLLPTYSPLFFQVDFYVDNVLVKSEKVRYNYAATPPNVNLDAFDLTGWSKDLKNITTNMRVDAALQPRTYVVVFKVDQTTIKEQIVPHGKDAVPPTIVLKPGHTFIGWKDDYTNVTTHRAIQAEFSVDQYLVSFIVEGNVYEQQRVSYQENATPPEVKVEGHDVIGWRGEVNAITKDTEIHAILRARRYTVTFADEDIILSEQEVLFGEDASAPDEGPWDQPFTNVTKDLYIQRKLIVIEPAEESMESPISTPVETINSLNATVRPRNGRWRYEFDVDLQEYEILANFDPELLQFQSLSLFNREVNWVDIDIEELQSFQLQHIETRIVYDVFLEESGESSPIFISQLWQQLLQFINGIFG
jgi:hypothetical protein